VYNIPCNTQQNKGIGGQWIDENTCVILYSSYKWNHFTQHSPDKVNIIDYSYKCIHKCNVSIKDSIVVRTPTDVIFVLRYVMKLSMYILKPSPVTWC